MTMEKKKNFNISGILMILVALVLLTYTGLDAFKIRPAIKERVDTVTTEFRALKSYLDQKLPEIDSALVLHTRLIEDQNTQLDQLNKLTEVLKK